ncbi:MAG: Flagellum site-determining protein YlxH [Candidatus Dichloromethanomonas elyunquensis]|nr:MAG: Flagellum site-determining protein YlxH [Candidatus Dichloromethanomonas elyunquensis]
MNQPHFYEGQKVNFTTNSELYHDIYVAEIKKVYQDRLELALTLHKGYLLLIPIGTVIRWLFPNSNLIPESKVISRQPAQQTWSVSIPAGNTQEKKSRVIAIGSGKGGVGKTTLAINLSLALSELSKRVIILDADIGMANVELLLKLNTPLNLTNVLKGECNLRDILTPSPFGIKLLPGSSGISSLTTLNAIQFNRIISGFADLEDECDIFIIDTGAGISEVVLKFLEAADDLILITTAEPHALMDTYGLTKALAYRNTDLKPQLIINRCETELEAIKCSETFNKAASRFLKLEPELIGWIYDDKRVTKSLKTQKPLYWTYPNSDYSVQVSSIAKKLIGKKQTFDKPSGIVSFINKLKRNFG